MSDILRRIIGTTYHTRAPGSAWSDLLDGGGLNPPAQPVGVGDARDPALVLVHDLLQLHRREVAVVEVVEAVSGVSVARSVVGQVPQSPRPQDAASDALPVVAQLVLRQRPRSLPDVHHSRDCCPGIDRIVLQRFSRGTRVG